MNVLCVRGNTIMMNDRKKIKGEWLTIPNAMSLFRLLLIPLIVRIYCFEKNYYAAVALIALSALTDVLDGKIARKFNMVSDIGKVLDPIADKLTQGAVIICLINRYPQVMILIVLFCIKEIAMLVMGCMVMHYDGSINSAKWYGKACTVVLDSSMAVMVLMPSLPDLAIDVTVALCCLAMILSLVMYTHFYVTLLKKTPVWTEHENRWETVKKIVIVCIWAIAVVVLLINKDRFTVDEVLRYSPKNPILAAVLMMLLFALKSVSIVVYCGILYAADGILFPLPVAIILNIIGTAIMVSIPYFIGRRNGKELSEKILSRFPKAVLIKKFRDKNDFMFTLIVRLVGLLPCDVVSLYFGSCRTNYPKYLAACIIGMLPPIITLPIIGTNASNVGSPQFIISICINICCIVGSLIACAVIKAEQKNKERKNECIENPD